MTTKTSFSLALVGALALSASANPADPQISNVSVSQNAENRRVTVTYDLDEDAIVTMDVLTNGVSIGDANISHVIGDCNRLVSAAKKGKTIKWMPHKSWPGHVFSTPVVTVKVTAWAVDTPPDYMVIDLAAGRADAIRYYTSAEALPDGGLANDVYRKSKLVMRKIHAAGKEFLKGGPKTEYGWTKFYGAGQMVSFEHDYYIGIYPVTQEQHRQVTGETPGTFGPSYADWEIRPIDKVPFSTLWGSSTMTADPSPGSVIRKFREKTGSTYALQPTTDAQWEFACRAGTTTLYNDGKTITSDAEALASLAKLGWSSETSNGETHPVGRLAANAWGLYDMHGNIGEMCIDWLSDDLLNATADATDPLWSTRGDCTDGTTTKNTWHVLRGGGYDVTWKSNASSYQRTWSDHWGAAAGNGYRLAVTLK